jgi:hydrogenase maturation protease
MKSKQKNDCSTGCLVAGAGNILLSDEGMGIHVLRVLEKENFLQNVKYVDIGTSSLDIGLYLDKKITKLIIIDSVYVEGYESGTVFKMTLEDLVKKKNTNFSLHQFELIDALKLIDLEDNLPETLILGIVPQNIDNISLDLSAEINKDFSKILNKIKKAIIDFVNNNA